VVYWGCSGAAGGLRHRASLTEKGVLLLEDYKNVPLRPTGYGQNLALMMLVELLVWDAQGLL